MEIIYKCDFCEFRSKTKLGIVQHKQTMICYPEEVLSRILPVLDGHRAPCSSPITGEECSPEVSDNTNSNSMIVIDTQSDDNFLHGPDLKESTSNGFNSEANTMTASDKSSQSQCTDSNGDSLKHNILQIKQVNSTIDEQSNDKMKQNSSKSLHCCTICSKAYKSKKGLKRHENWHSGKFHCHVCNSNWSSAYDLKRHMRVHTGKQAKVL